MQIHGLNKTTLLDYPGRVAATLFTGNCNFRCPFCQNKDLVLNPESQPVLDLEEIYAFLSKRRNILSGVCITGGEPTLQDDLELFIEKIKSLGYQIKLDTNGYKPDVLKNLVNRKLIDYVAMDIKSSKENYGTACGITAINLDNIENSVDFLLTGKVEYEFRTTVVKELHTAEDFEKIGKWLCGASAYFLQSYKESDGVIKPGFHAYEKEELLSFKRQLDKTIRRVELRGVD